MNTHYRDGLHASLPIAAGYIPVAVTFGLLSRNGGLSTADAVAASLFAFAGAAQFMAIGMFTQGIAVFQIVTATFLLNLRHILLSSVVVHRLLPTNGVGHRALLAYGVTDEVFAVATRDTTIAPTYLLGLETGAYSSWVFGTLVGAVVGSVLPPLVQAALGFALYALFLALLLAHLEKDVWFLVPAVAAAAVNAFLRLAVHTSAGVAFPVAMVAGTVAGFLTPVSPDVPPDVEEST